MWFCCDNSAKKGEKVNEGLYTMEGQKEFQRLLKRNLCDKKKWQQEKSLTKMSLVNHRKKN